MTLYRAGKPGETTAGYSNFFASAREHADRYRRFSEIFWRDPNERDHADGRRLPGFADQDRTVLYRADVWVRPQDVLDLTPERAELFAGRLGPDDKILARLDSLGRGGQKWVAYPDWMGIAWVYLGAEPIQLTPVVSESVVPAVSIPEPLVVEQHFDRQRFDNLAALVDRMPMANSYDHGRDHWMHEAWTGLELADRDPRVDRGLVLMFAMIHDSHRENERSDPSHGQRAADFAKSINDSILKLPPEKLQVLTGACVLHDRGRVTTEPTIGACWDADRLQLMRVGTRPHPFYLSTAAAPLLIAETTAFLHHPLTWDEVWQRYVGAVDGWRILPSTDPSGGLASGREGIEKNAAVLAG